MTARDLRAAQVRVERAARRVEGALEARDDAIRALVVNGATHAEIHRILNGSITRARIGQIAKGIKR